MGRSLVIKPIGKANAKAQNTDPSAPPTVNHKHMANWSSGTICGTGQ